MKEAKVVVGLNFGDEGKGITTARLCNKKTLVVRFSGGSQAGHTVYHNGIKHVSSNFGAGVLLEKDTFISKYCAIDPVAVYKERQKLNKEGISADIFFDPLTTVITPYDVMANRKLALKDGTCGRGISTSLKRNTLTPYKLYFKDLAYSDVWKHKLLKIKEYYTSNGLIFNVDEMVEEWVETIIHQEGYYTANFHQMLSSYDDIVFEGSQGILLDMDHGFFPHVTYSSTTSKNVWEMCRGLDVKITEIHGVTRSYLTRHGNGPMFSPKTFDLDLKDDTNVFNEFQGHFKTSKLNENLLLYSWECEMSHHEYDPKLFMHVTCTDQVPLELDKDDYSFLENIYYHNKNYV